MTWHVLRVPHVVWSSLWAVTLPTSTAHGPRTLGQRYSTIIAKPHSSVAIRYTAGALALEEGTRQPSSSMARWVNVAWGGLDGELGAESQRQTSESEVEDYLLTEWDLRAVRAGVIR